MRQHVQFDDEDNNKNFNLISSFHPTQTTFFDSLLKSKFVSGPSDVRTLLALVAFTLTVVSFYVLASAAQSVSYGTSDILSAGKSLSEW